MSDGVAAIPDGRVITACGIITPDHLCFVLDDADGLRSQSYLVHHLDGAAPDRHVEFGGDVARRIAVRHRDAEVIVASRGRNVLRHGPDGGRSEPQLRHDEIVTIGNVRLIGERFHLAGSPRRILRREGVASWSDLTGQLPADAHDDDVGDIGFDDVDGFGESELYAVGGYGDAWRFDGDRWDRLELPVDAFLLCVHCASDGSVHIGGSGHTVLRGRDHRWEVVHTAETNQAIRQIVELDGRLYAVDDWASGLYEITDDGLRPADLGGHELPYRGATCLATGHGLLLVAGNDSASLFDGTSWRQVVGSPRTG